MEDSTGRTADALRDRVQEFADAYSTRDPSRVAPFADDSFQIIFLHPELVTIERDEWLEGLKDFQQFEVTIGREAVFVSGGSAIVQRELYRSSTSRGMRMKGYIGVADSWLYDPNAGWRIWKRIVTPMDINPNIETL